MKINYEIIEHSAERYDTVGDYWIDQHGVWQFRVSRMSDPRYIELVFIHELIEARIAHAMGVTIEQIDVFDTAYEEARTAQNPGRNVGPWQGSAPCGCALDDEPGDDRHCPVYRPHQIATHAERMAAKLLKVDWDTYEAEIEAL